MNLLISFNHLYTNWYVSELYKLLIDKISNVSGINVEIVNSREYAKHFNINSDYHNGVPSVLSPMNLLIMNKDNGKTFIHSFHDYSPAIMESQSGIDNFNVVKFSCSSNLTPHHIERFKNKFEIQPSVYILELINEHDYINSNRYNVKNNTKAYFNGLCYGVRERYKELLSRSDYFDFRKKEGEFYRHKPDYYSEISNYKYGLSLNGAAKICYRDLEYFGMGILNLRETLDILTYEPLIPDLHYVNFIDYDIQTKIHNQNYEQYIINKLEEKMELIFQNENQINNMIGESRGWFERNCIPNNQVEILFSFLNKFEIFL
jgi:hypothetical protein